MNYILFDGTVRNALLPFTFTRPVADIRIGILTIREKWEKYLRSTTTTLTEEYLSEKFPMVEMEDNVMINASFLPNDILSEMVNSLEEDGFFEEHQFIDRIPLKRALQIAMQRKWEQESDMFLDDSEFLKVCKEVSANGISKTIGDLVKLPVSILFTMKKGIRQTK